MHVTPTTHDLETARRWFEIFEGAGLDGLIAKPADIAVRARQAADVQDQARPHGRRRGRRVPLAQVRAGRRLAAARPVRRRGHAAPRRRLRVVQPGPPGRAARRAGAATGTPARAPVDATPAATSSQVGPTSATGQRRPGGVSRWTGGKNLAWEPLRPELVVEVGYDAMEGDRFRHTAQFKRWRPDRDPRSCGYDQLERPVRFDVDQVLAGDPASRRRSLTRSDLRRPRATVDAGRPDRVLTGCTGRRSCAGRLRATHRGRADAATGPGASRPAPPVSPRRGGPAPRCRASCVGRGAPSMTLRLRHDQGAAGLGQRRQRRDLRHRR